MRKTVSVSLDENLLGRIDAAKGLVTRSRYLESVLSQLFPANDTPAETGETAVLPNKKESPLWTRRLAEAIKKK